LKIEIHLFASLSRYLPEVAVDKSFMLEIKEGANVQDIINRIGIPQDDIKLIFINGVHAKDTDGLKDGDRLGLFPPIGGG
jgi:molybdopterin converting factor small subunit